MVAKVENELKATTVSKNAEEEKEGEVSLGEERAKTLSERAHEMFKGRQPPKRRENKMIKGIDGFFYLTERILICPFPGPDSGPQSDDEGQD